MNTDNKDTYQKITDYVIEQLEKGEIVWQKNWNTLGMPKNICSGNPYKGWNVFFLNFITMYNEYRTPYFITYKQAMEMGGTIRRGQKGHHVIWWATMEDKSKLIKISETGEEEYVNYRVPKMHTVFNIDQTHGIEFPKVEKLFRTHSEKLTACEKLLSNVPDCPTIMHGGDRAFYDPVQDFIKMPPVERFHSDEAYYKTLFHEIAHSTGHAKRLNRKELMESDGFGKENYSKEELTAELTAAYLCAVCGIQANTITNSAAYLKSWLDALKADKKMLLKASTQAQAAADYILNIGTETSKENSFKKEQLVC